MPGLDGTGPRGKGPGTGRGLGRCAPEKKDRMIGLIQNIQKSLSKEMGSKKRKGPNRLV